MTDDDVDSVFAKHGTFGVINLAVEGRITSEHAVTVIERWERDLSWRDKTWRWINAKWNSRNRAIFCFVLGAEWGIAFAAWLFVMLKGIAW